MQAKTYVLGFSVDGRPYPQGSKRGFATKSGKINLVEVSKGVKGWREKVRAACEEAARNCNFVMADSSRPMSVEIEFYMPRNQGENRPKNRELRSHVRRPDIDKLARAILDAITGVAFHDDSQVTYLQASKRLAKPGAEPGVYVRVTPWYV